MRKTLGSIAVLVLAAVAFATPTAAASSAPVDKNTPRDLASVVAEQARTNAPDVCWNQVYMFSRDNGRYVSAELNYGGDNYAMLRARAGAIGPWEQFRVCFHDWYWTIQSQANGLYVAAEVRYSDDDRGMLRARSIAAGPWERFTINVDECGSGCTTIRSQDNGQLVAAEMGYSGDDYGMLRARSTATGPWERFFVALR
ncbi:fascin domain-containing protein [Amycolatopsis sp. NPDC049868]|uniref:fascin domain-containing protein n=1 Tax=Amycolatopsis sp. NPDC049868 TaxID=3363934 RepID=UPI0037B671B3